MLDKRGVSSSNLLRPTILCVNHGTAPKGDADCGVIHFDDLDSGHAWNLVFGVDWPAVQVFWGISSAGRAPGLQPGGHRFEPGILHHCFWLHDSLRGREASSLTTEYPAIGSSLITHTQCASAYLVKLLRAYGECLGANSR